MSKVSRSVYQKLAEENKRLLKDIKILVNSGDVEVWLRCQLKWFSKFKKEDEFNEALRLAVKEYIKDHKDELPNFLTNPAKEKTPCNQCQGGGCPTCSGTGYYLF